MKPDRFTKIEDGLPTKGFGPFRKEWYSICSSHYFFKMDCERCVIGTWENVWMNRLKSLFYAYFKQ